MKNMENKATREFEELMERMALKLPAGLYFDNTAVECIGVMWPYVKKKYKLKVNFSYNLPFFIQPIFPSYSISVHTHSRIHLVIDIHNDYGFLPYYKMSLCIQILIYRHGHNFLS